MAIQYAGGTNVKTTSAPSTRAEMADFIHAALIAAGWSATGSPGDWVMTTATTPSGFAIRMRVWDPATGSSARLALNNISGAIILDGNAPINLFPDGSTYTVIANQYQFFCFISSSYTVGRLFAAGGVPFVPSFLEASYVQSLGWLQGNSRGDVSTMLDSFRTALFSNGSDQIIIDEAGVGNWGQVYRQQLVACTNAGASSLISFKWYNSDWGVYEPLLMGNTGPNSLVLGQIWDAFVTGQTDLPLDEEFTFDSNTFHNITQPNPGSTSDLPGALCVMVPSSP
jgi:hypothetical protein